jgi:glycopeptide antibiotics resistance protein
MGYLANFSRPFLMAVALWPFVSFMLTIPVLALLYHRDNRILLSRAIVAYGTVLYSIGLLCFTIYPMPENPDVYCATHHLSPQLNPFGFITDIRTDGMTAILQLAMNVMFFLPLGFIMGRVFRWRFRIALPAGFAVSLMIETMQLTGLFHLYPCSYRLFDVDDLATNTLGAVLGFLVAGLLNKLLPAREADRTTVTKPGFLRRLVAFVIDMALVTLTVMPISILATLLYNNLILAKDAPWQPTPSIGDIGVSDMLTLLALVVFELSIPWMRGGRTLGGSFTHMTCETRPRNGWRRVAFYLVRTAALAIVVSPRLIQWSGLFTLALLIFYGIKHRMPYDLMPADPMPATGQRPTAGRIPGGYGTGNVGRSGNTSYTSQRIDV